jgi:hypothetical protein
MCPVTNLEVKLRESYHKSTCLLQSIDDINGVTSFLQFPTEAEGEILLGEQFKCYVRIINLAEFVLDSVQIKVQSSSTVHSQSAWQLFKDVHCISPPRGMQWSISSELHLAENI